MTEGRCLHLSVKHFAVKIFQFLVTVLKREVFCYVSDLVDGIYKLLMSNEIFPVNIGNPEEITIKQFAEEVIKLTGSKSKLSFHELPEDDPKVRQPDISKAKRVLGWEPKVSRSEGLKITVDFFKKVIPKLKNV
ncbi:MAG: hypothetical protein MZV64_16185 [Ignavibacteriales bacterium]|nr:hypothetical protein [Ignavibacteriales bacterium]